MFVYVKGHQCTRVVGGILCDPVGDVLKKIFRKWIRRDQPRLQLDSLWVQSIKYVDVHLFSIGDFCFTRWMFLGRALMAWTPVRGVRWRKRGMVSSSPSN